MTVESFLKDVFMEGTIVQIGSENSVIYTLKDMKEVDGVGQMLEILGEMNLYYLGGVKPVLEKDRAKDIDVSKKNYVYFDFDLRKEHPDMTDDQIKDVWKWLDALIKEDELLAHWRYVVFTGNGLHLYYFFEPVEVQDKEKWKGGMSILIERMEGLTTEKLDHACCNVSRIARLPGSLNMKSIPGKKVEIIAFEDRLSTIGSRLEEMGATRAEEAAVKQQEMEESLTRDYPDDDTFKIIQRIPINKVVTKLFGWKFDGKNFFSGGATPKRACFVPHGENFLVHGGTHYIPATQVGFRPFDLVRTVKVLNNAQTFFWFESNFPEISVAKRKMESDAEIQRTSEGIAGGSITDIFTELSDVKFELLKLSPAFDIHKFIIRGAVTRIGAFSNIGKSKFAYFLSYTLLKNGYNGIVISSEVPRSIVLANLLTITSGSHFWDIVERRYNPTDADKEVFRNLEIYDVTHTNNSLMNVEAILHRATAKRKIDFIVIDFCQGMLPRARAQGEYEMMSRYALEVQSIAQRYQIAVIDLSQISNAGLRDEFSGMGMIPFKGSGHLYSSADIGILLKRESKEEDSNMKCEIRKHKYLPPQHFDLECDFRNGKFKVFGSQFEEAAQTIITAFS